MCVTAFIRSTVIYYWGIVPHVRRANRRLVAIADQGKPGLMLRTDCRPNPENASSQTFPKDAAWTLRQLPLIYSILCLVWKALGAWSTLDFLFARCPTFRIVGRLLTLPLSTAIEIFVLGLVLLIQDRDAERRRINSAEDALR